MDSTSIPYWEEPIHTGRIEWIDKDSAPGRWSITYDYDWAQQYIGNFNYNVCNCENSLLTVNYSELNFFRNCSISSEYILGYRGFNARDESTGPSLELAIAFWREALPEVWRNATDPQVHEHMLLSPYFAFGFPIAGRPGVSFWHKMIEPIQYVCWKDVCESLGFTGNPDMAGIGMMGTYLFAALCTTLCFAQFYPRLFTANFDILESIELKTAKEPWIQRHKSAMRKVADSLLGGSVLLCCQTIIAGMLFIHFEIRGGSIRLLYDSVMAIVLMMFSVNPTMCLMALLYSNETSSYLLFLIGMELYFPATLGPTYSWL